MSTLTDALLTFDQFLALPDRPGRQEFDRGRVIAMPPPKYIPTITAKRIYDWLVSALQGTDLTVFSEAGFLLAPEVIRQPDVAVVEQAMLENVKSDEYLGGAPLVAIEVASPANSAEELDLKIDQYLRGASQAVWVAYPKRKAIVRYVMVAGRIHGAEHRPGDLLREESIPSSVEFDPAEFF